MSRGPASLKLPSGTLVTGAHSALTGRAITNHKPHARISPNMNYDFENNKVYVSRLLKQHIFVKRRHHNPTKLYHSRTTDLLL